VLHDLPAVSRIIGGLLLLSATIALAAEGDSNLPVFVAFLIASVVMLEDRRGLMQSDTIKLVFTYTLALIVVVGGGAILFYTRLDPTDSQSAQYGLLIAGFIGSALTWAFTKEAATQATRAAESTARETRGDTEHA
jgi:hypothetical protein